jgi:hypothetical protein
LADEGNAGELFRLAQRSNYSSLALLNVNFLYQTTLSTTTVSFHHNVAQIFPLEPLFHIALFLADK